MAELQSESRVNEVFVGLAKQARSSLGKLQAKVTGRETDPWLVEKTNFKLITEDISPILSDLCSYRNSLEGSLGSGIGIIDFGLRPKYDPRLDDQPKFIAYDGFRLGLWSLIRGDIYEPTFYKEIKREQDLDKHEGKEADKNMAAFRRLSKKDVLSSVIFAIESSAPSVIVAPVTIPDPAGIKPKHVDSKPTIPVTVKSDLNPDSDLDSIPVLPNNTFGDIKGFIMNIRHKKK